MIIHWHSPLSRSKINGFKNTSSGKTYTKITAKQNFFWLVGKKWQERTLSDIGILFVLKKIAVKEYKNKTIKKLAGKLSSGIPNFFYLTPIHFV